MSILPVNAPQRIESNTRMIQIAFNIFCLLSVLLDVWIRISRSLQKGKKLPGGEESGGLGMGREMMKKGMERG
tara:strand:+ start:12389 stop:12607 length:219 start_codon:yes stop_codon:yes gene_type:complete